MKGLEIIAIRKKLGLTQKELGIRTGVSLGAVQSWEYGKRNISQSAIIILKKLIKDEENKQIEISNTKIIIDDSDEIKTITNRKISELENEITHLKNIIQMKDEIISLLKNK